MVPAAGLTPHTMSAPLPWLGRSWRTPRTPSPSWVVDLPTSAAEPPARMLSPWMARGHCTQNSGCPAPQPPHQPPPLLLPPLRAHVLPRPVLVPVLHSVTRPIRLTATAPDHLLTTPLLQPCISAKPHLCPSPSPPGPGLHPLFALPFHSRLPQSMHLSLGWPS